MDTEFTDFIDCDLISIGLVTEDGQHEFYAERTDFDLSTCSDFVRAAVLPLLGKDLAKTFDREQLGIALLDWFKALPYEELTLAYDYVLDYELLKDALGGELPARIKSFYDLRLISTDNIFNDVMCKYHKEHPWHHALHDSHATRLAWIAWDKINKPIT